MNPKDILPADGSKTGLVITAIVVLVAGFLLFNAIQAKERERGLRIQKEQELSAKLNELVQVQTELADLKRQKEETELKMTAEIGKLQEELDASRQEGERNRGKLQDLTRDKTQLSSLVDQHTAMIAKLNKKIQALEREKEDLRKGQRRSDSSDAYESTSPASSGSGFETPEAPPVARPVAELHSQTPDVVDLGQIVLHGESREPAQVEHVNTMYGFIVVSAGSDDGLKLDTVLNVVRDNRFIAKAVVKKVRSSVATALLLPEWAREEVRLGDQISVNSLELPQEAPKRRLADFLPR